MMIFFKIKMKAKAITKMLQFMKLNHPANADRKVKLWQFVPFKISGSDFKK
jgi:hypothetical protein